MALLHSTKSEMNSPAHPFSLPGVDGNLYSLNSFNHYQSLLIVFMCNHCPYVIAVQDRINQIAKDYALRGLAVVGISSNDSNYKQEDSFENMKIHAQKNEYVFPYLFDESQEVARAYDAVCTPDPYLYEKVNGEFLLRYRGRIDDSWKDESLVKEKSLRTAIELVLKHQPLLVEQVPSMGCSIKWKNLSANQVKG